MTIYVARLAYTKKFDVTITAADRLFLPAAATSLPRWYLSSDPLRAAVALMAANVIGFGLAVMKAFHHRFDE